MMPTRTSFAFNSSSRTRSRESCCIGPVIPSATYGSLRLLWQIMAGQLGLFGNTTRVLVDDASGRIAYYPAVLDEAESAELFRLVVEQAPWKNEQMWMYDKMVDVPRKVAYFGTDCPPMLSCVKERLEVLLDYRFSNVALNYYRDGRDSVAWHS